MYKLAFYKAEYGDWKEKILAFLTGGPFSHVEFILQDFPNGDSLCFSSSTRDGGTRIKRMNINNEHWIIYPLYRTESNTIYDFCIDRCGVPYDWWSILLFFFPFTLQNNKYYCSEIVSIILNTFFQYNLNTKISVNELFRLVTQ